MSNISTTAISVAKQKKNIAWLIFIFVLCLTSYTSWSWYKNPNKYVVSSTVSVPNEHSPADFWTNTGLVSAKTKATEIISSESFIRSTFEKHPAPSITITSADYAAHSEAIHFPFSISVKKTPATGKLKVSVTDVGENSCLIKAYKNGENRSVIVAYGSDVSMEDYVFNVIPKQTEIRSIQPVHTDLTYECTIYSNQEMAQHLLNGAGGIDVSQVNDVIQITVKSLGDEAATNIANTLAEAYVESVNNIQKESDVAQSTPVANPKQSDNQSTSNEIHSNLKTLLDRLSKLESTQSDLESLTRNIRERFDENYADLTTEQLNNESITHNFKRLAELYEKLENNPEDHDIQTSIEQRKRKIGNILIDVRKETALKIENTKDEIKNLGHDLASTESIATAAGPALAQVSDAMLIPATTMEADMQTSPWAWWTATLGLLLLFLTNRVTVFRNRYRIIKNEGTETKATRLPNTYPIKSVNSSNTPLTQPVEHLCAELLSKDGVKTIAITSFQSKEGKSYVSSRLAMCLATLDKKVLLIDMSFQKPHLATLLSCETENELCDVAKGSCELLQAITPTSLPGLDLLAAGSFEHGVLGFMAWAEREASFKQLRNYYDYIIIDTDSLSSGPEAVTFLKMSDLNLIIDSANGMSKEKNEKMALFVAEKGLRNTFVTTNSITKKTPTNKPVIKTEKTAPTVIHTVTEAPYSQTEVEKKPAFLKRVALWFF